MRRLLILALLLAGMQLILPLGSVGHASEVLLAFGFLILAAYTVGEIATYLHLPKLVGYLVAGIAFGPSALGTVSEASVANLSGVSQLAVALIAFLAGAELRWSDVRERWNVILKMMTAELALTFLVMTTVLVAFRRFVPPLEKLQPLEALIFGMLFAAVAIVHSPAVTMALLSETKARGAVARTTLGVVLIADVVVVLVFSALLAIARRLVPPEAHGAAIPVASVFWEIGGAIMVGALLGAVTALYLRFVRRELLLFAILVAFFGTEITRLLRVETMLALLTAGFVTQNVAREGDILRGAMERSAAPVIVVFFALAGAKIDIGQLAMLFPLALPLAVIRATSIWAGTGLGARWARAGTAETQWVWFGLVSQAGVALALVNIFAEAYPARGIDLRALMLSLIAINEMVGPAMFRRALVASGETSQTTSAKTVTLTTPQRVLPEP